MTITGLQADPNYRYSINEFIGDGERISWEISFDGGYLDKSHVKAITLDFDSNREEISFEWTNDNTIVINPPVSYGWRLILFRETPKDSPLADFNDGAIISEDNLDRNAKQAIFVAAEATDRGEGALAELAPRALLVPAGEIAPTLPPRTQLYGKALAVDLRGRIVGADLVYGIGGVIQSNMVIHDGDILQQTLRDQIDAIALTGEEIQTQAEVLVTHGEQLIERATSEAALDERLTSLRTDHDSLAGVVDALTALEGEHDGLATLIAGETSQRITGDTALAARIAVIGAASVDGKAIILDLDNVKVSPTESLADRFEYIEADFGEVEAQIQEETTALANAVAAEAVARQTLGANLHDAIGAAVETERLARVLADSAEATSRTQLAASLRNEMQGTDQTLTAAIQAEQNARVNGDRAEASDRESLAATLRGETAALITNEQTARATAISGEATARQTLATTLFGQITSQVQAEATTRANGDSALAGTVSLIGAVANGGAAFQLDTSKVLVDGGQAIGQKLAGVDASLGIVNANISSEQTARVNQYNALANNLSVLSATVGGYGATLTQQGTVNADLYGRTSARWSVTAIADGRAQLSIYAEANGGAGVDITGNVRIYGAVQIYGNVLVNGSINGVEKIVPRSLTDGDFISSPSYFEPGGGVWVSLETYGLYYGDYKDLLTYTLILEDPAVVDVIAGWKGGFTGSSNSWVGRLEVNGSVMDDGWGAANHDKLILFGSVELSAGTHVFKARWQGNDCRAVRPRMKLSWRYNG
jgi:hypothetical protein